LFASHPFIWFIFVIVFQVIYCTSLNWSADGSTLFSGYTDGVVRVWGIGRY